MKLRLLIMGLVVGVELRCGRRVGLGGAPLVCRVLLGGLLVCLFLPGGHATCCRGPEPGEPPGCPPSLGCQCLWDADVPCAPPPRACAHGLGLVTVTGAADGFVMVAGVSQAACSASASDVTVDSPLSGVGVGSGVALQVSSPSSRGVWSCSSCQWPGVTVGFVGVVVGSSGFWMLWPNQIHLALKF